MYVYGYRWTVPVIVLSFPMCEIAGEIGCFWELRLMIFLIFGGIITKLGVVLSSETIR